VEKAVKLYYAVRDGIKYNPYLPFFRPEHFRASNVLKSGQGYCITKASLLCALGRACNIPTRVGFANVRNHLATRQWIEYLEFHGVYADIPVQDIVAATEKAYDRTRVRNWIKAFEQSGDQPIQDFGKEDVL
jgi:transglutaminase-like putative cysteine protease